MAGNELTIEPVGRVSSPLRDRAEAPKQGDEAPPDAWLEFEPGVADADTEDSAELIRNCPNRFLWIILLAASLSYADRDARP